MAAALLAAIPELIELAEGAEAAGAIFEAEAGFDAVLGSEVAGLEAVGGDLIAASEAGESGVGSLMAEHATSDIVLEEVADSAITEGLPRSRMKWLISNAQRFGKWVAIETGKNAIIQVGFEVLSTMIRKLSQDVNPPTLAAVANSANAGWSVALKDVFAVLNDWHTFAKTHLAKGRRYGIVTASGVRFVRFELFVRKLAELDGEKRKVIAAVADAKKKGTPEASLGLRPVFKAFVEVVLEAGKSIDEHEVLMKKDGLNGSVEHLESARRIIIES